MYLHLGENTVVRTDSIIGIFDMDTSTISKWTKDYLSNATKNKRVINVSMELPKSFVVCNENNEIKVYVSQISSQTLMKRKSNFERKSCYEISKVSLLWKKNVLFFSFYEQIKR